MKRSNPVVGASALVQKSDESVLLIKRIKEPGTGRWAFAGGVVEYGETVEQTAVREVKEETGIDIKLIELVGAYDIIGKRYHYVTICFRGRPLNTKTTAGYDVGDARWFTLKELPGAKLTSTTRKALRDVKILRN